MPVIISIIVPVYNVEQYLNRCVTSLVNQTLKDIEIILVDDGSPDCCPQMCDEWAERDSRIKVVHKKNEGLGFARNSGLEIAKGEYVAFVDSDDFVDVTMFGKLLEIAKLDDADIVYCGLLQQNANGSLREFRDFDKHVVFREEQTSQVALSFIHKTAICQRKRLFMSVWHSIYKRRIINENNITFYSEREVVSEDLPFQAMMCNKAKVISFIPDCLYNYCYNGESLSHTFKTSKISASCRLREVLLSLYPDSPIGQAYVNAEFYGRIRSSITALLLCNNIPFKEKMVLIKDICRFSLWKEINIDFLYKEETWKYMKQYEYIRANRPYSLVMFALFDWYFNKRTLLSLVKR